MALQADVISALTVEVLKGILASICLWNISLNIKNLILKIGNVKAYDSQLHNARPHAGQKEVAARLRSILSSKMHSSKLFDACESVRKVQDPYTMRCIPQVHGVVIDTIKFCKC